MATILIWAAVIFTASAALGSSVHRGAGRMVALGWWGGFFTMGLIWYWMAHRAVG